MYGIDYIYKKLRVLLRGERIVTDKSIKKMLLGISIMIAGIYIHMEPGLRQSLYGNEFVIVLLGFSISLIGYLK